MQHPDSGTLQALLDDELPDEERNALEAHVGACQPCAGAVAQLEGAGQLVSETLPWIDVEPTLEGVPSSLKRRAVLRRGRSPRVPWARAAILVLVFGGAASAAIPGSPVRGLVESVFGERGVAVPALTNGTEGERGPASSAAVGVAASAGVVRIVLSDVSPGAEVEVAFVDGEVASVTAGATANFSTAPGLLEVTEAGAPIRVEIPRSATGATVIVDGALFLRKAGARIELPGPTEDSTAAEIRFRVPR